MGANPLEIRERKTKSHRQDESRSNSNKTPKPLDPHHVIKAGNVDPYEFNACTPRTSKCQEHDLDSSKDALKPEVEKKESRWAIVGVKGRAAQIYVYVGPRAQLEDSR